jgi:hypothetical protein
MRLIKKPAIFQVCHDVTHRCGTQRVDMPPRNTAGRDGLARLDVLTHHVGQNLLMASML